MITSKFFIVSAALLLAVASATRTRHQEGATEAQTGTIPRRKLIVHIGPHKTGTTYFQSRLAAQGGVSPSLVYPNTCGVPTKPKGFASMAHSYLNPIDPHTELKGHLGKLVATSNCSPASAGFRRDFYSTTSDIIISAEAFCAFGRAEYQKLRDDFAKDFDVHVVVVRADSRAILLSHFHQNEKAIATVSEYANQVWKQADYIESMPPCRFASEKCIHDLSDVFGRDNVHLISYEGLKGAGVSLIDAVCDTFARDPSECFKAPKENGESSTLRSNVSPEHLAFSASMIFNRLAMASECPGRLSPESGVEVQAFIKVLQHEGVEISCRTLRNMQEADCNDCFLKAVKTGTLPAKAYYFSDEYSHALEDKLSSHVCEFEELTVFASPRRFSEVSESVKYAACAGTTAGNKASGSTSQSGKATHVQLEKLHSLFASQHVHRELSEEKPSAVAAAHHIEVGSSHENREKLHMVIH